MYVFKAKTRKSLPQKPYIKSRVRAIWGKVTRLHGSTGSVRARFRKNLPGHAMGQAIRVVSVHPNQHSVFSKQIHVICGQISTRANAKQTITNENQNDDCNYMQTFET